MDKHSEPPFTTDFDGVDGVKPGDIITVIRNTRPAPPFNHSRVQQLWWRVRLRVHLMLVFLQVRPAATKHYYTVQGLDSSTSITVGDEHE